MLQAEPVDALEAESDEALIDGLLGLRQIFPSALAVDAPFRDALRDGLAVLKETAHA